LLLHFELNLFSFITNENSQLELLLASLRAAVVHIILSLLLGLQQYTGTVLKMSYCLLIRCDQK